MTKSTIAPIVDPFDVFSCWQQGDNDEQIMRVRRWACPTRGWQLPHKNNRANMYILIPENTLIKA